MRLFGLFHVAVLGLALVLVGACGSSSSSTPGGTDAGGSDPIDASTIPATCGNGTMDPGEQCDDGNDSSFDGCRIDCMSVAPITPTPNTWQFHSIPGTKCIDGTTGGFSTNYNPSSTKLVIFFEGGGACFNSLCDSLHTWGPNTPTTAGIFDRNNTANPVRDWSWVYIPYCSGDVYAGQNEMMLGGQMRYFYGYSNIRQYLERIVPAFSSVDQVLLTGLSAGGFGSTINFPQTQRAFGSTPVYLFNDSGPPMSATVYPPCLQQIWRTVWRLDRTLLAECGADCNDAETFGDDYFAHILKAFPTIHGGLYSTLSDQTIRGFAGYGWTDGYNMCGSSSVAPSGAVYTQGLDEIRTAAQGAAGWGSFYITGTSHTRLRSAAFYTTMVGNVTLPQWLGDLLDGTTAKVGP